MATKRNTVVETTPVRVKPEDVIKKAFFNGEVKHDANLVDKLPKLGSIKPQGNFDATVLVDNVLGSFKKADLTHKDLSKVNYADAALLAKSIATVQKEYQGAMALIIKDMIIETIAAVELGTYVPKLKNGLADDDYIARFLSRAKAVIKANPSTIVAKGPYFVFGWVDDNCND